MFCFICFGTVFSWLQAPIQAYLRPALWLPGLRSIHRKKEFWNASGDPNFYFHKLKEGLATLQLEFYELYGFQSMKVPKVDGEKLFIQAHFLTPLMQWLDVVELQLEVGEFGGTKITAHSFSTGVLPICFPLFFLVNMVLFFIPFYDWGQNKKRLELIRKVSRIDAEVQNISSC